MRERSSRSVASFVSRSTWLRVVARNSRRVLVVEVLVGEELEEAGEREQRRAELVRRVRDELLPGPVELGELDAHPVERAPPAGRPRRCPSSTTGSSKAPSAIRSAARCRRPSRRAWIAATANPEHDRDQQRDDRRVEQPPLDERDRRELIRERAREEHHVAVGEQRSTATSAYSRPSCTMRARTVPALFAASSAVGIASRSRSRPTADESARELQHLGSAGIARRRRRRRVRSRRSRRRRRSRRAAACSAPEARVVDGQRLGVALQLIELRVDEPLLERRDHDRVGREERAADDAEQRQRQLDADAARDAHPSRKRYPAPRTVRISSGSRDSTLDLLAQVPDVDVDRARLAIVGAAAEPLEQLPARVDDAGVRREQREQLEFDERQLHELVRAPRPCAAAGRS